MEREQILQGVRDIVFMFVQTDSSTEPILQEDDVLLGEEFGIDSIAIISILVEIERRFNIEIEDEYLTMDLFSTLGTLVDLVYELLGEENE